MNLLCLLAREPELRAGMAAPERWLTPTEAARLASLGTAARRNSFLAGRWLARLGVQQWRGEPPEGRLPALDIADSGACLVADVAGAAGVQVSISHSAGVVACAVGGVPVGVDIEALTRPRDHLALAETVHGPAQRQHLAGLPPQARAQPFLQWWTLKEAWLKARGRGLDFALMRTLAFEPYPPDPFAPLGPVGPVGPHVDVAVATLGDLVLAVAADPALPPGIDGPPGAVWHRYRAHRLEAGA